MRARTATLAGLVALTTVSVQAASPFKAIPGEPGAGPSIELVRQGADGVAPRPLARPLRRLALGALSSELVI